MKKVHFFKGIGKQKDMMQGTPQGGVLSPLLFNMIMNTFIKICQTKVNGLVLNYADNILIQTKSYYELESAITRMKTKLYTHNNKDKNKKFKVNGMDIERVET